MGIRKYLVGVLVFVLLIWGPIDHSWPAWLLIRTAYLIIIPIIAWVLLSWIWKIWCPDVAAEDRLRRTLAGTTAGVLLAGAILTAQADYHSECTQKVRTPEGGYECVGDYIPASGPDLSQAFMLIVAAGFAFLFGVRAENKDL